jgi:hypothetical protein
MAVSPILNNGMIQRTDDVAALKSQQDHRPLVEQQSAQTQMARKADEFSHQVVTLADSNKADTHTDAREEGKNKYFFAKKKDKKIENELEERVIKKNTSSRFDMKV